jgi:radical SAM superfamily enzyme YgiQ (UPF0313 family)
MVTKELLRKMRDAGCIAVWFGVESGSQRVIDAMSKGISIEQTRKTIGWAKEVGLMTVTSAILGFPGETKESALETTKLVESMSPDDVGYYIATPYPGTPMYDYVKEKGWLKIFDFDKYDTATPVFETPTLTMEELREIREEAFHRFYLRPGHILRIFSKGGLYGFSLTKTALAHLLRAIKAKF